MSEHTTPGTKASDEIDLGQLLVLIKNGFKSLGNIGLRIFLFLKKHLFILLGLILLGVGISYGLNQLVSKKLKTEVIVRPNFDSTDYLKDVVEELRTNLITKDETFFKTLEIKTEDLKGFDIALEPIEDEEIEGEEKILNQLRYLETLNKFKDQGFATDILRSELAETSIVNYKLSFQYIDAKKGPEMINKLLEYINTNEYFNKIKEIYSKNAQSRIDNNTKLIVQIDDLVSNFSNALKERPDFVSNNLLFTDKESLDTQSLLDFKKNLIEDIEEKKLELVQQSNIVSVLNYGKTQQVRKPFFNDRFFKIPMVLVLGFLFFCFIRYLNIKSKELS